MSPTTSPLMVGHSDMIIDHSQLSQLQTNLIRSHCAGVGEPLSREQTRRLLALRMNVLAKGHSGIRTDTLTKMVAAFNADCLSVVPSQVRHGDHIGLHDVCTTRRARRCRTGGMGQGNFAACRGFTLPPESSTPT